VEKRFLKSLQENSDILINEWTKVVKNSSEHYRKASKKETRKHIEEHFWALIDIYEKKNYNRLIEFLSMLADARSKMGFTMKETHLAFLNGQSVILRFLDSIRNNDQPFCGNCREIMESFDTTQALYSQIYQDLKIENTTKTYRQEIHEKELRLSSLTEATPDAVIILDENLNIRSWNRGAEDMYQYKKEEIINQPLTVLLPQNLIVEEELKKLIRIIDEKGSLKNYQTERIRKDGEVITVNITSTQLKNDSGKIIGISAIHRDLTEQKRLEQEIRSQEQLLSSIVDNSVDAIIGLDLKNKIISWNQGAEKIFGYQREEVIGVNFDILFPEEAIKSGELKQLNEDLMKYGSIQNYESERITKSGKRISTSLTRSLIRDKRGKVIGSSAILRDISEYKNLKKQMSHSEKLSVVGQLAAGIAHEVGNPLTSISSLIQVLSRTSKDNELHDRLRLIKKQTDRITRLIRDLVNFSQPSDFIIKQTDINQIVKEAINIIKYDKRAQDCKFELQLSKNIPILELPEDQILQVFINILLNAVDAVPHENGEILIQSEMRDGAIKVLFRDNGYGIPKQIMDKIFDPFFTTKDVGKGTGLGLWVSYSIIESLNGEIKVKSSPHEGTIFTVVIPI